MNETPKTSGSKSKSRSPGFRRWLILLAVVFLIVLPAFVLTTHLHGWQDWLPAMTFVGLASLVIATGLFGLWRLSRSLCCWRNLRRAFFVLACLATIIGLFYAEEDWRGRHAWNQFRQAAEAKGVHFDLATVIPPPVPDEQNFALTPVVASGYGQNLDRTGHEIWPRNDKLVNRLSMHFWLEGDDPPSKLSNWTLGQPTDLAALQQYYRSLAAKTNTLRFSSPPQSPAADVLFALSRFDPTIGELRQAGHLPFSRFPLEYDKENPLQIMLPHLAALKCATQVLSLRSTAELQTGQSDQALADVALQLRLTESVHTEPFLISHLVRVAMVQLTLQPIWEGLADHRWTEPQLAALEAELASLDFLADYQKSWRSDWVYLSREINYLRHHPDQYIHLNDGWTFDNQLLNPRSDVTMAVLMGGHLVPSTWFYQNQLRYARFLEQYYQPAADVSAHAFMPALIRAGDAFMTNECQHLSPFNILECLFLQWPITLNTGLNFAHGQSFVDLARVAVALERCRLAQGRYPSSLDVLAPAYLDHVPHDLIGGQPLHYRLTEDGRFVLYSVGWNETDDGGVVALTQDTSPSQDLSQGDWVWCYPQK